MPYPPNYLRKHFLHTELKSKHIMESIDKIYLAINSVLEYSFLMHILNIGMGATYVQRGWEHASFSNTVCAMLLFPIVNDLLYAPAHRFLHWPPIYPWIHKHHHREYVPS